MAEAVTASAAPAPLAARTALAGALAALCGALVGGVPFVLFLHMESRLVGVDLEHLRTRLVDNALGAEMRTQAVQAAHAIDAFLAERIVDARQIAATPRIVEAVIEGARRHEASSFHLVPIEELESMNGTRRSRGYFPDVDAFLRHHQLANRYFAEIFVTDSHGFNVAYSSPTSDYVQSDEDWWKSAWGSGVWIGDVEMDRSAATLSIDLAIRIDEPESGDRVGVLKAVIDLGAIQELLSLAAEASPGTAIAAYDAAGRTVAETASGHTADRILSEHTVAPTLPAQRSGWMAGNPGPLGYARTAGSARYARVGTRFAGLGWVVTAELDQDAFAERVALVTPLGDAFSRAGAWPATAAFAVVAASLAGALLAFVITLFALRRVDQDLGAFGAAVDAALDGRPVQLAEPRSKRVARLARGLDALARRAVPTPLKGGA